MLYYPVNNSLAKIRYKCGIMYNMKKYTLFLFVFFLSFVLFGSNTKIVNAQSVCAGAPTVGSQVRTTERLRVRSAPVVDPATIIGVQEAGATGIVIGNPITGDDGHCWLQINYDTGADGLSATSGLELVSSGGSSTGTPGGTSFPPGCTSSSGFSPTTGQPCSGTGTSGGGITTSSLGGFSISSSGQNSISIVPVYLTGTSYTDTAPAAASALATFWNGQAAGSTFHLTATPGSPLAVSAFVHNPDGSCQPPGTADNTMYLFIGSSTGGVSCTNNTPYFIANPQANSLAHEFGHILGLGHTGGTVMDASVSTLFTLNDAQKQQLGWLAGGGTPPGGGSASCPGRVCEPVVNTQFGSFALSCPATSVQISQGTIGSVQLMAIGTYGTPASVTVPVRGGTRFTPNIGIRSASEMGTYSSTQLSPGGFLDFQISVLSEVPVGTYSVPLRATLTDYEADPTSVSHEPRLAEKYSYCNMGVQVVATGAQPTAFGRIYSFAGAGIPISEIRTQPGQTVPIAWSSSGVSACYLKVNGQSRALPSGSEGTRGGTLTSDPVRSGVNDSYELKCQISGAAPGELTAPAYLTVGPAGGVISAPGSLTMTLDAQGDSSPFYGTVPKDSFGAPLDFVHVSSGGNVTFQWTSQNAGSCSVSPTGATTLSGGSGISGIVTPVEIRLTCISSTTGERKSKSVQVLLNPGEAVTGQPPSGSLSCDPFRNGYAPGSTFSIHTRTTGATGNINFEVSMQRPADNPTLETVSSLTNRPAGDNNIDFHMGPVFGGKTAATIFITITAKTTGGGTIGSCLTVADIGAYATGQATGASSFSVGATVQTTGDRINLRSTAGGDVVGQLQLGELGTVTGAPQSTPDGRLWVQGSFDTRSGWIASDFLKVTGGGGNTGGTFTPTPSGSQDLSVGDRVTITTSALNMRSAPGLSGQPIGILSLGKVGTVTNPHVSVDGYTWVGASFSGASGYVAEKYLTKVGTTTTPTPIIIGPPTQDSCAKAPCATTPACPAGTVVIGVTATVPPNYICGSAPKSTTTCSGFDTQTGFRCGCVSTLGYSKTTGESCAKPATKS